MASNNYIEEFFIAIGFDTKRVKKEAGEVNKILDSLSSKRVKSSKTEAKERIKTRKLEKQSDVDNFKFFLSTEKRKREEFAKTQAARRKQAVSSLITGKGKSAKDSASVFQQGFKLEEDTRKAEKIKDERQRARQVRRIKHRGKLASLRKQEEAKVNDASKKALMERLRIHKRAKSDMAAKDARDQANLMRIEGAAKSIRRGAAYNALRSKGKLGDFDKRIDKAVINRDVEGLKDLRSAISRTNGAMGKLTRTQVGLHTVQNGLTDSTRNMIRSYASVFALFQGTVAIKRIGQEFQGMNAAMLAVNGTAEAAAVDMQFLDNMVNEMGLNLKNTTDAYVKFKFAAKGKIPQTEIEDLFTSLSMFGTSLKVLPVDMQRAQRAIAQINCLGV